MSALPPITTAKADFPQTVMSALPRKADMRGAAREGRYGPRADMPRTTSARTNNVGRSTNWCARWRSTPRQWSKISV